MIETFGLILNKITQSRIETFIDRPSHALLLIAPMGAGKGYIARIIASNILQCSPDKLDNNPNFKLVQPVSGKVISIKEIREVIHFTTLKTVGSQISRLIIVENSQTMTRQAQNALLKTIEDPPANTIIILTTASLELLLPTILSRVQQFDVRQIDDIQTITSYFKNQNYSTKDIDRALLMSGGLIGLMSSLLKNDKDHPLFRATTIAHDILQHPLFDRLVVADELGRNKVLCSDVLFTLGQMATISISRESKNKVDFGQWHKILKAVDIATEQLSSNAQPKLIMLNFMLSL